MLTEMRVCRDCRAPFVAVLTRGMWPTRCPRCADVAQRRPSVVLDRRVVAGPFVCRIAGLPALGWERVVGKRGDSPSFRMAVKGAAFGPQWSGRIDLYAPRPWEVGALVALSEMQVVHALSADHAETRAYVRLGRPTVIETLRADEADDLPRLVWRTARDADAVFDNQAIWSRVISGGERGGVTTVGVLAIVDSAHPLLLYAVA